MSNITNGTVGKWTWEVSDDGMSGLPTLWHGEFCISLGYGSNWGNEATGSYEDDMETCALPDKMLSTMQAACAYLAAKHGTGDLDILMVACKRLHQALENTR